MRQNMNDTKVMTMKCMFKAILLTSNLTNRFSNSFYYGDAYTHSSLALSK